MGRGSEPAGRSRVSACGHDRQPAASQGVDGFNVAELAERRGVDGLGGATWPNPSWPEAVAMRDSLLACPQEGMMKPLSPRRCAIVLPGRVAVRIVAGRAAVATG